MSTLTIFPVPSTVGAITQVPSKTISSCDADALGVLAVPMKDPPESGVPRTGGVVSRPVVGVAVTCIADEGLPRCGECLRNPESAGKAIVERSHHGNCRSGVDLPPGGDDLRHSQ